MAKGLDVGTCFLACATVTDPNNMSDVSVRSVRDAFVDIPNEPTTRNMLKMSGVPYISSDDTLYIVGDAALRMANMFQKEVRRPMAKGVLSAGETEAEKILMVLLKEVLGAPATPGEVVYFSVPAAPIDSRGDVVYHEAMFKKMIESLGYSAFAMNEAAAIVYSNCMAEGFTALASSLGAGNCNTALVYQTIVGMAFASVRSGDFIDAGASHATGNTASKVMSIKEQGVDLLDPTAGDPKYIREREAIAVYYKNMIHYNIESIKTEFKKTKGAVEISDPITWVIGGGTTLIKNFLPFFKQEFDAVSKTFPIPVKEIRLATDQLNDVAKGLLVAAMNHD